MSASSAAITRSNPFSANCLASSRPMPLEAPVTSTSGRAVESSMCAAYPTFERSLAHALKRARPGEADLAAQIRVVAAPPFLVGHGNERRDRHGLLVLAERDHGEKRGAGVADEAPLDVLGLDADADL